MNGYRSPTTIDDDDKKGVDGAPMDTSQVRGTHRCDEVVAVRKMSSKDTNRLRLWRLVVTEVLSLTALALPFTTYTLLEQQEDKNFQTAVSSIYFKWFMLLLVQCLVFQTTFPPPPRISMQRGRLCK